jgi:hypothetical protein
MEQQRMEHMFALLAEMAAVTVHIAMEIFYAHSAVDQLIFLAHLALGPVHQEHMEELMAMEIRHAWLALLHVENAAEVQLLIVSAVQLDT